MNLNRADKKTLENVAHLESCIEDGLGRGSRNGRMSLDEKIEAVRRVHRKLMAVRNAKSK
jgi:hypothetical protein